MKKGFFSHQLCYRQALLNKHILYLTVDDKVDCVIPFRQELPMTTFCDGILLAVVSDFMAYEADFCRELQWLLSQNHSLSVGEAILKNRIYCQYGVDENTPCVLYSITSIDWETTRLRGDKVVLKRVV